MPRFVTDSGVKIKAEDLQDAIADILRDYGDVVYEATEEGLDAAEKVLIKNLSAASPRGKTGKFAKSWKSKGKKYNLVRYVGNTKTVPGKKGDIPLSNILEYSTIRGKPFIKDTYYASIEEMAAAVVAEIKEEA
jgi:hypothetical protein